jgi:hypothetical protein
VEAVQVRLVNALLKLIRTSLVLGLMVCACVRPDQENRSLLEGYPAPVTDPPAVRNPTPTEAADFGFRFENRCVVEIIDAFRMTYQTGAMAVPIPMRLTNHERATILEAVTAIRFFDLPPAMFQPDGSKMTLELAVDNGVAYHAVRWRMPDSWPYSDDHPASDEYRRLTKLVRTIRDVVHARPEIDKVRPRGSGC